MTRPTLIGFVRRSRCVKELNPAGSAYFDARAKDYANRLVPDHEVVARIRKRFAGTPVVRRPSRSSY